MKGKLDRQMSQNWADSELSSKELQSLIRFCATQVGLSYTNTKKTLLQTRIRKRQVELGFDTLSQYLNYVLPLPAKHPEKLNLIDVLTTNTTSFFREAHHFDVLIERVVSAFLKNPNTKRHDKFRVWSAGCSIGAEPYSLAMVLKDFKEKHHQFNFEIVANDICLRALEVAKNGVYPHSEVEKIDIHLRKKYLLRNKKSDKVKVCADLMNTVTFHHYNMLREPPPFKGDFDAIFCRNVMIYFSEQDNHELFKLFYSALKPDSYLLIGHSETMQSEFIQGHKGFKALGGSVYQKVK